LIQGCCFAYEEAVAEFGPALERLARGYESDPHKRNDLLQEIHVPLWQSFKNFDNRCSLHTWVDRHLTGYVSGSMGCNSVRAFIKGRLEYF
jgi:DNA-directed RNA polymerase specialized sigma24 family protein